MSTATVTSSTGPIRGLRKKSSEGKDFLSFRGIPYAQAPINERRFRLPLAVRPWTDILDAFRCGPDCPQYNPLLRDVIGEEDNCLTLNVYTRSVLLPRQEDLLLPVMVWIHGGGFAWGSGSDLLYGPQRAMNQAIVLVTINYRLGPLGFMTGGGSSGDCPQNIGLHDQRMALRWMRTNAAVFGGDPQNITLMGESAGAASVHYQALKKQGHEEGLFQRIILQSGSALCPWAQNIRQLDLWQRLQALLNGQDMRLVDVRRLLKVASAKINASWWHNSFLPSRDGDFFDDILGLPTGMDVMVGITANEGAFLTSLLGKRDNLLADVLFLHDKSEANDVRQHYGLTGLNSSRSSCWHRTMTKAISDALFVHPLYRQLSKGQTKVLVYKYSHRSSQLSLLSSSQLMNDKEAPQDLVSHFDEVLLQFPNKLLPQKLNEADDKVARFIWSTWSKFAEKGCCSSLPCWPHYGQEGSYLDIGVQPRVLNDGLPCFRPEPDMAFWDRLLLMQARRRHQKPSSL